MGLRRKRMETMTMEEFVYTDSESLYSKLKHQHKQLALKRRWLMGITLSDLEQKRVNRSGILQDKKTLPESFLREDDVSTFINLLQPLSHNNWHMLCLFIYRTLPESFLREDDVHYGNVKAFVSKGFGVINGGREYYAIQDNIWTFDFPCDIRKFISILDEMSNSGLQLVAEVLTGGSLKVEKTRWKMKKFIKQHLPELLKNIEDSKVKTRAEQLCEILRNPQNFQINILELPSCSKKLHAAALKILDGVEDLDSLTLSAMYRKLRGIQGYIPQLQPKKSGWTRNVLIYNIRNMCMKMLSELGDNVELQEPLTKAMAIATLYSNLIQGCPSLVDFRRYSSKVAALQNEIAKAIWLLDGNVKNIRFPKLKNVQIFLDPNAELSNRSLRTAVKNLLIEFLFECSDLKPIPELLFEILSIVNRTSRSAPYRFFSEAVIEEEVENVLCVSAQMREILWDLLPEFEYGHDFADAYMEDLEDSDDDKNFNGDSSDNGCDKIEGTGETSPVHLNDFSDNVEVRHFIESDLMDSSPSTSLCFQNNSLDNMKDQLHGDDLMQSETNKLNSSSQLGQVEISNGDRVEKQEYTLNTEKQLDLFSSNLEDSSCEKRNHYFDVQEACDKTSLVAYQLIGCLLEEFAEIEGLDFDSADASYLRGENMLCNVARAAKEEHNSYGEAAHGSVIIQVLEELLPSFPESGKEKVKELIGLK